MTNFIYNMQDELFNLPLEDFSIIKKLVDHIEAQGKQLRELNAAITKRNKTIEKYEREKKELQKNNSYLIKKVGELNEGIRNSEDLTWKQKYKNDAVPSVAKAVHCPWGDNAEIISAKTARIKELEEKNKTIEKRCREAEKALEDEKQVSKDLNVIINSKNKLLDEYMTKCNNLEHNYKKEVRMKEQFKMTCFRYEVEVNKLKRDNAILSGKVKEISDLAESIVMLCDDEE